MKPEALLPIQIASNLTALDLWREQIGVTATTVWRWRQREWLKTVNICGRLYISRDEISRFEERAALGEFSKAHATPKRKGADG